MRQPKVTIALATYNRVHLLPKALESALSQSYPDLEVVVCDDGSTDGTLDLLATYKDDRLRVVTQSRNRGIFANVNACLSSARGLHFLLLMDDDFLEPSAIDALMTPWKNYSDLAFSYGQYWVHRGEMATLKASQGPGYEEGFTYATERFAGRRATLSNATLFRTQILGKLGGYPKIFAFDVYVTIGAAFHGKVAYVETPVSHYLVHPGTQSNALDIAVVNEDREVLLELWRREARRRAVAYKDIRTTEHRVRKSMAVDAAARILSLAGEGQPRTIVFHEAQRLRRYLSYHPLLTLPVLWVSTYLPRPTINVLRSWRRRLEGARPASGASSEKQARIT